MRSYKVRPEDWLEPKTCWVGDRPKIIYPSEEEAEVAARNAEVDHHLPAGSLAVYRCEHGNHYHLTRVAAHANV